MAASSILMIRPKNFGYNYQTKNSNAFQKELNELSDADISGIAIKEFDGFVDLLRKNKIDVNVFEDTADPAKPDAVFPNNWITLGSDGTVTIFPMESELRQKEVRLDIIDYLKSKFKVKNVVDLREHNDNGQFLEGTGSMIIDHKSKKVYACISSRTNQELLAKFADVNGYDTVIFRAKDEKGKDIYHTNVMMTIGKSFAVICCESIPDTNERDTVIDSLANTGHKIIDISYNQMKEFVGNMLEIQNDDGKLFLVMSKTAMNALTKDQLAELNKHTEPLSVSIETIEAVGGGSARCMMAEIFLSKKI